MTTKTTQSAATLGFQDRRGPVPRRKPTPTMGLAASSSFQPRASSLKILIANARLEFNVSHSKQNLLRISNRERIAIFHPRFHPLAQKARATTRPPKVQPRFRPLYSSFKPRASSLQNLIANPELEFPATTRKQSIGIESNRKKIAISYFDSHPFRRVPPAYLLAGARDLRSLVACRSSLVTGFLIHRTAIRNPCKALKT